ncbi:DUF2516 family protein [Streptomyces sp. NRRL B-24572]|uniref:DUF2516 family protein n=1 Tax=Streptomyces TaxID=1883 RepID=UPI000A3AAF7E|nr:DUF2516 family protein [Streptomyces sp. NRRL B-24572]
MLRAGFDSLLSLAMFLVFTGFAVAALVFAALAREDAYRAADKQTKKFWLIILGINLALALLLPSSMFFLQIAGLIAAIVFMVDVRPALAQVSGGGRGGRRGGGSSSDGPYGPYNGGR